MPRQRRRAATPMHVRDGYDAIDVSGDLEFVVARAAKVKAALGQPIIGLSQIEEIVRSCGRDLYLAERNGHPLYWVETGDLLIRKSAGVNEDYRVYVHVGSIIVNGD